MSNDEANVIPQLTASHRDLHEGILARISAQSEQHDSTQAKPVDTSAYIARIVRASSKLKEAAHPIGELEADLDLLQMSQARTSAELEKAKDRCDDLERSLASVSEDATRAESLAAAAQRRANDLEHELAATKDSLHKLLAAIGTELPQAQPEQELAAA